MSVTFMDRVLGSEALREEMADAIRAAAGSVPRSRVELQRLLARAAVDPALDSRLRDAVAAVAARNEIDLESDACIPLSAVLELGLGS